jgi:hypothetical protein
MRLQINCSACGLVGTVLVEEEPEIPRCPRCGGPLAVESVPTETSAAHRGAIDDEIVSWLSRSAPASERSTDVDLACSSCGFAGLMPFDSARGDTICPACLAVYRTKPISDHRAVTCPACGLSVEVSDRDRGKTILCPDCRYFLGCVIPAEKHAYRGHRAQR